jgi:hypothetical protein
LSSTIGPWVGAKVDLGSKVYGTNRGTGSCSRLKRGSNSKEASVDNISENDVNQLVREIDSGGDGEISIHEFAAVLEKYQ